MHIPFPAFQPSLRRFSALALAAGTLLAPLASQAQTEVQWWHSMVAVNGEWVNDLARDFNASQKEYKVIPTFKGSYDESMTAAIAAFRAGNAPHILQVFEVGTATMMASKGAIVPVAQIMKDAGYKFDPTAYVSAVAGYYTAPNGQMLSFPFNSSTTIFYYNKDAFKPPACPPTRRPRPGLKLPAAAKLKAAGHKCPFTTAWQGWTQLESFSSWHNVEFASRSNGLAGMDARMKIDSPLHQRHIENLANMAKQGLFVYKGRGNVPEASFVSGECAMINTSSAFTATSPKTPNLPMAWPPCPTTPTCPAHRKTP